ncbi:MAG: 3-isopropylmalate/(R)-2-methylmalate dehydratase small subunit [Thermoproteota archaeon]|nr:3-isopropylmalate/(R)-2-methylmalate dehydratase small subunit [Thermoproteota archaeon]
MMMDIKGKVIKYGDSVNTDVIIPSKFLVLIDPKDLAKHAMEGIDPDFSEKVKDRKIIVAGRNFGSGSSREQAPVSLKYAGVQCVLAESFARIFYRNAINIGLPIVECDGISKKVDDGEELEVIPREGLIKNLTKETKLKANPIPDFLLEIMEKGLVEYMKERKVKK